MPGILKPVIEVPNFEQKNSFCVSAHNSFCVSAHKLRGFQNKSSFPRWIGKVDEFCKTPIQFYTFSSI